MRNATLFVVVFIFFYLFGPERFVQAFFDLALQIYHGQLPGQLTDLSKLADIATIAGFILALWIFMGPAPSLFKKKSSPATTHPAPSA